jgi:TonB family protein
MQDEEDINQAVTINCANTNNINEDSQPVKMSNSQSKYIDSENGNIFTAFARLIKRFQNTNKSNGSKISKNKIGRLALAKSNEANGKFVSFADKSTNSSEISENNDVIKNKEELISWLRENIDYEINRIFEAKYGRLVVLIEVGKNGTLANCTIKEPSHPEVDRLVLNIINQAPLKMQAFENGFAHKQRFEIPIKYNIQL